MFECIFVKPIYVYYTEAGADTIPERERESPVFLKMVYPYFNPVSKK